LGSALPLIVIYLDTKFYLTVVLKLFAGQGTRWTDGGTDKGVTICFPLWGA